MSTGGRREFPQREQPVPRPKYGLCLVCLGNRVVVSEMEQRAVRSEGQNGGRRIMQVWGTKVRTLAFPLGEKGVTRTE